jgi:hypothetical protein
MGGFISSVVKPLKYNPVRVVSSPRQDDESNSAPTVAVGVVWIKASSLRWKNRGKSSKMPTHKLTPEIITAAVLGFEQQKRRIDDQIAELRALLPGGSTPAATSEPAKRKRRKMSAAGRKAISEAQRKRWAASKKAAEPSAPAAASKPKRKLSRAGRAAIVAATKKRWDAVRAAKAQQEKAAAKKSAKKTAPAAGRSVTETGGQ